MQYPKMLYKGDQENYQTVIAYKEDHEAELIADGWADYGELPEFQDPYAETADKSSDPIGFVPTEQFDALASKVVELEQENAELSKKLRIKELDDTSADDLKALLTERNIPFGARDSKAVLLNLVIESDGGE